MQNHSSITQYDPNITAKLIYDGQQLIVPLEMLPEVSTEVLASIYKMGQLQGSPQEQLCELSGRICYDSLGRGGRNSILYWEHIRQVRHHSVLEHAYFTIEGLVRIDELEAALNRKGVFLQSAPNSTWVDGYRKYRLTINLRAILEWERWTDKLTKTNYEREVANTIGNEIYAIVQPLSSLILPSLCSLPPSRFRVVDAVGLYENHVSFYLSGGRTFSHAQIRHRENVSQRSSLFCDEDTSPWIEHPLLSEYFAETKDSTLISTRQDLQSAGRKSYLLHIEKLQKWLQRRGVSKLAARKQARGAARSELGSSLKTEMIFTASVDSWRDIIRLRLSAFDDAEIRHLYSQVLTQLKASRFGAAFANMSVEPSPDGLGVILKEK